MNICSDTTTPTTHYSGAAAAAAAVAAAAALNVANVKAARDRAPRKYFIRDVLSSIAYNFTGSLAKRPTNSSCCHFDVHEPVLSHFLTKASNQNALHFSTSLKTSAIDIWQNTETTKKITHYKF